VPTQYLTSPFWIYPGAPVILVGKADHAIMTKVVSIAAKTFIVDGAINDKGDPVRIRLTDMISGWQESSLDSAFVYQVCPPDNKKALVLVERTAVASKRREIMKRVEDAYMTWLRRRGNITRAKALADAVQEMVAALEEL
jgi:hypothetical protein